MARDPTRHGGRPPKDARHHAPSHLGWPVWLRGLGVGLCRRTRAGGLGRPITWGPYEATAEEIKTRPAEHLAFQHFEAVDMPLDRAGRPGQGHPGFDRLVVLIQPFRKALPGLQRAGGRALEPGIELLGLALAYQGGKVLRKVDRLGHLDRLRLELGELLGLGLGALRLTPEHQPGGAAWRKRLRRGLCHARKRLAPALASGGQALGLAYAADIGRDAAIAPRIAPRLELPKQLDRGPTARVPALQEVVLIGIEQTPPIVAAVLPHRPRRQA